MTDIAPGWYPDPSGAPATRWWDGNNWSASTRPLGPQPQVSQGTDLSILLKRNRYSAITFAICIVYAVLAVEAHIAVLGILPVLMTVRAFRGREPLAFVAAIAAAAAVIFALTQLAG